MSVTHFWIWSVRMKVRVQKVWITMQQFAVITVLLTFHNREKVIFLHYTQNRLGIMMDSLPFQRNLHSAIAVCIAHFLLAGAYLFRKRQILCGHVHPTGKAVVSASGHLKESTHFADGILLPMPIDSSVFDRYSHFLSVSERKSRISSFSVSSCFIMASLRASL